MTPRVRSQLGEFFRIKHGYAFKGEFFNDAGPWILTTPGNFFEAGGLKERGDKAKRYDGPVPEDFILRPDDLVIAMTDLKQTAPILGASALIRTDSQYLHNQRIGKVIDLDEIRIHKKYLFYVFNWQEVRAQIRGSATGSTVRHTAPERIYSVSAPIPPLPTQRRIASILSAYDDLIENNTKRIEILEEMARSLYREWFVHFRFPGHEKVKLVDSELGKIPEGWKVISFKDIYELCYGKALKKETRMPGSVPVYGSSGIVGWHDSALVSGPGIIVGRKGNVGTVFFERNDFYPIDTTYHLKTSVPLEYAFFNLQEQNFINNDAAVPGLSRNQAYSLQLTRPPERLLAMYLQSVAPVLELENALHRKNDVLRQTRDLLLPKLISGEIDVDALDLPEAS